MIFREGLFIVGLLFVSNLSVFSQEENSFKIEKCARLQGGIITHLNNEDNSVTPGIDFRYCYGIKMGKRIGAGFGAGYQYFKEESFIPIIFDLVYFPGESSKRSFIYLDGGYSLGWSERYKNYANSSFSGGPVLGIGYGIKIFLKEQYAIFLNAGYQYQHAQMKFEMDDFLTANKELHYHMFVMNLGLMLEQ